MYQKANCSYSAPNEIITCFQLKKSPIWSREDPIPALFLTAFPKCHRPAIHHQRHAARLFGPVPWLSPEPKDYYGIKHPTGNQVNYPGSPNNKYPPKNASLAGNWLSHPPTGTGTSSTVEDQFSAFFSPVTVGGSERPISAGLLTPAAETGPKGKWALPFPLTTISLTVL